MNVRDDKYRLCVALVALAAVVVGLAAVACGPTSDSRADGKTDEPSAQQADHQASQLAERPTGQPGEQQADRPARRPGARGPAGLAKGQEAPLFDLPLLVYEQADDGELTPHLSEETIDLSSFRGRQVVCVFFSSYT